jgi:peroxygenase
VSPAVRDRRVVPRRKPGRRRATRQNAARFVPPAPRSAPNSGSRTALQKHVDFFDADHDGQITLADTYQGLRRLGLGAMRSAAFAGVINAALGTSTSGAPSLTVDVEHIHSGKHGSDTGVYDRNGRFSLPRFRRLFDRFDVDRDDALDDEELGRLFAGNQTDLAGHLGSRAEFGLLLGLAGQDRKGKRVLTRERLERFYNGSLFYQLAREVAAERGSDGASLPGMLRNGLRAIY